MRLLALALLLIVPGMVRQVARVAVSWSTVVLFGEVPRTREPHLVVMGVGCLVWAVAVVGVVFPPFAAILFGFIPLPEPYGDMLAWYVMVVLAVAVPPVVSVAGLRTLDPDDRPRGPAALGAVLVKGYPYTACLAAILLGMAARVEPVAWVLRVSTRILTGVAGPAVQDLLTKRLSVVRSDEVEVVLHLSDVVIRGAERDVNRVHAPLRAARLQQGLPNLGRTGERDRRPPACDLARRQGG